MNMSLLFPLWEQKVDTTEAAAAIHFFFLTSWNWISTTSSPDVSSMPFEIKICVLSSPDLFTTYNRLFFFCFVGYFFHPSTTPLLTPNAPTLGKRERRLKGKCSIGIIRLLLLISNVEFLGASLIITIRIYNFFLLSLSAQWFDKLQQPTAIAMSQQ